ECVPALPASLQLGPLSRQLCRIRRRVATTPRTPACVASRAVREWSPIVIVSRGGTGRAPDDAPRSRVRRPFWGLGNHVVRSSWLLAAWAGSTRPRVGRNDGLRGA